MRSNRQSACGPAFFVLVAAIPFLASGCQGGAREVEAAGTDNPGSPFVSAASDIDAGRYIVEVGGCNDCHTDGFVDTGGQVPESEWLTGSVIGQRGPWGTTYPRNLRLTVQALTEDAWVEMLRTRQALPPMPWPSVNSMSEADARAVYRFIRSLGPAGKPAPAPVGPDVEPATPYFLFVPQGGPTG